MANDGDPSSTSMSMLRDFHSLRFAAARDAIEQENPAVAPPPLETAIVNPPPRSTAPRETNLAGENLQSLINSIRSAALSTPRERETCLQSLFNLMTRSEEEEDAAPFQVLISRLDGRDLQRMASLLTSDSDYYFLEIARNGNGNRRLQKLLGKSDDADTLFVAAILRHFFHVMIDKHASNVAIKGLRIFSQEKKMAMWRLVHGHAIHLARDRHGCIALTLVINVVHDYCRNYLLDIVAHNALYLSYDPSGNFVVQHVLRLNNLRCTCNIAASLRGNCVELSFQRYGSYIVEKLLETDESRVMVVAELLGCEEHRLMSLASSEFGNFVVGKALRTVTRGDQRFWVLVNKLMPFLHLLRRSHGRVIAGILDSI